MSEQGYSPVGQPPQTPGLPNNPLPTVFSGFTGLNTKASQQGIQDQEMFVCDGFMPLGPNNLRSLRGIGAAIYTATSGKTIDFYSFNNLGSVPICVIALSDGSMVQLNLNNASTTMIAAAGTLSSFPPDINQFAGLYIIIVSAQSNGYFLWDGQSLFKAGTLSPEVTITNAGSGYVTAPTITTPIGTAASGFVGFSGNPSNGDTITLDGYLITFKSVVVDPTHDCLIGGTLGLTMANLTAVGGAILLNPTAPALAVATYTLDAIGFPARILITYKTGGSAGNNYTLAASAATPSGAKLTGGSGASGSGATFSGTVVNGSLTTVRVENPGSGFQLGDTPVLTIRGGGSDDMASAQASISTLSGVLSVVVANGGGSYTSQARVVETSATGAGTTYAISGSNGTITAVAVLNPGIGYTSPPDLGIVDVTGSLGTGAVLTAVLAGGQIGSVSIDVSGSGTGYTTPPTLTVIGDGVGAQLLAELSGGTVTNISVVSAGTGYTRAQVQFSGGNRGASAVATLMPYGVQGTTVETFQGRVWVGNGRTGQVSAPASPADFSVADGATAFQSNDSFLRERYTKFIQSNGFLYLFADSSINYISGVSTSGNPPETTFNNLNVDPQIGTPWRNTVQAFGRDLVFANSVGVFVNYGGAVTKISDPIDGIFSTVAQSAWPAGFEPSAAVMTIFGIRCYILAMPILDQVTGLQVIKCLMWDGKRWWTSPQEGFTNPVLASQDLDSVLTGYCTANQTTINSMFSTRSEAFMRYLYSKLWDNPGVWQVKMQRQAHGLLNVNYVDPPAVAASGFIGLNSNPTNGQTITLNGYLITFKSAVTNPAHECLIAGTLGLTMANLIIVPGGILLNPTSALLSVATYSLDSVGFAARILITYATGGSLGNSYTLAASAATPSAATLTGGSDGPSFWVANVSEYGIGAEVQVNVSQSGPAVFGPLSVVNKGSLMGMRFRTAMADIQINSLTMINQNMQSKV